MVEVYKCMKCNDSSTRCFTTGLRGYGSKFDNCGMPPLSIYLCEDCAEEVRSEWFEEKPTITHGYLERYLYEKEIVSFIEDLPKPSRDLINIYQ